MGWSTSFFKELYKSSIQPVFKLQFHDLGNGIGRDFVIFSHGQAPLKIGSGGVQVNGVSVIPSRWSVSFGGYSVAVVGDTTQLFEAVSKGSFASLFCQLGSSDFERLAIGQLQAVRRNGFEDRVVLQFVDLLTAFQNTVNSEIGSYPSPSTVNPPRQDWFYQLGSTRSLTANWAVGDSTLTLTNTNHILQETGKNGVIKVQESSSSTPFFLEWSSKTSTTLATTPNGGDESWPSTIAGYDLFTSTNAFATVAAQLDDHPVDILGKLLESTGTGNNGSFDTLPKEWSIGGVFGTGIFDEVDANFQKTLISGVSTSNYKWRQVYDSPLQNGIRDFLTTASNVGQWAVFRQGAFTWRSCQDPNEVGFVAGSIRDQDIFQVVSHDLFDPVQQEVFPISSLEYSTTVPLNTLTRKDVGVTSGGRLASLPASREITRSARLIYSPDTNESDLANADLRRMAKWDHWTFERVVLRCKLVTSQFVAGDILEVTSSKLKGIQGEFQNKRALVVSSSFDFASNSSTIVLNILTGER